MATNLLKLFCFLYVCVYHVHAGAHRDQKRASKPKCWSCYELFKMSARDQTWVMWKSSSKHS